MDPAAELVMVIKCAMFVAAAFGLGWQVGHWRGYAERERFERLVRPTRPQTGKGEKK